LGEKECREGRNRIARDNRKRKIQKRNTKKLMGRTRQHVKKRGTYQLEGKKRKNAERGGTEQLSRRKGRMQREEEHNNYRERKEE
jgi:hypothetical protein